MSNVIQLFPQKQQPNPAIHPKQPKFSFIRLGVWLSDSNFVYVEKFWLDRRHTRWKKCFAYLPTKLDTGERVWWKRYMSFQVWDWTGGLMGGYVWYHKATVRKRWQLEFVERIQF